MSADKRLKIAFISSYDPLDKSVWSGTPYSIYRSLQKHVGDVEILGPCIPGKQINAGRIKNKLSKLFSGKRYNYTHSLALAKAYGDFFDQRLAGKKYDLIVAPSAAGVIAKIDTQIPIAYITDSTVEVSLNYHDNLSRLSENSVKESLEVERLSLENASLCLFSSEWAANSANNYFKIHPSKIKVLPFGANFEILPAANEIRYDEIPETWNLLFVAVYWESKGGEMAYNCLVELLKQGIKAKLTVCGCIPPDKYKHPSVEVIPFLNKNNAEDAKKLSSLFKDSHFVILPTRFDCTPIVICEASAYGLPTLCADTGGVKGHLKPGANGFLVDYRDNGPGYAEQISKLVKDPKAYVALRRSSRNVFDELLNWDHWALKFSELIRPLLK